MIQCSKAIGVTLAIACAALPACRAERPSPSVFVLITVDTLRADRLGAYGSELGLTPNLDALARESVVFESAYAPSAFTVPSVSSIMTGRYPEELGIWMNESGLPESASTLAGALRERGWRTLAVVSNFVLRKASGLGSGFDRYDDAMSQFEAVRKWPERVAKETTDAALGMLDGCATGAGSKCFLWVHYQDPHGPYTPELERRMRFLPAEQGAADGKQRLPLQPGPIGFGGIPAYQYMDAHHEVAFYRAGYDAEVNAMDEQVGRLLSGVADRGLSERAVIAFGADHGESLGEGDYWFAHGEYLSDVLVRVPLLFRIPGKPPARRDDVVSLVDLYGTVVRLVTGEAPTDNPHGRDLFDAGAQRDASVPYMATLGASVARRFGLVDGEYKWIVTEANGERRGDLFRREEIGIDLAVDDPTVAGRMSARLAELRAKLDRSIGNRRTDLGDSDRRKLRALGYTSD